MSTESIPPRLSNPTVSVNADGSIGFGVHVEQPVSVKVEKPSTSLRKVASTQSATLDAALGASLPLRLWHYTSPVGLTGILQTKEIWATNVSFLNDTKEVQHAVDYAKQAIGNRLNRGDLSDDERDLLEQMSGAVGSAAKRYYVASFSEEHDLLSQWRAYCPPGGGYALGLPSDQLAAMAEQQGFMLARCVYDHSSQYQILSEFTESFLAQYRGCAAIGDARAEVKKQTAWQFSQHVARLGPTLKHPAFREEHEWRLISPMIQEPHPQLGFRGSSTRVVPFFRFRLASPENPDLVRRGPGRITTFIGPTSDRDSSSMAVQFLMTSCLGSASIGSTDVPYRSW